MSTTRISQSRDAGQNSPNLTITYLVALALIASIAIASQAITQHIIHLQACTARAVDLAAQQRLLSQRTARAAEEIAAGTIDAAIGRRVVLTSSIGIEQAQNALMQNDTDLAGTPFSTLYADPPFHLQLRIGDFLHSARAVATRSPLTSADPDLHHLLTTLDADLLPGLEHAISRYRQHSESTIAHLQCVTTALTLLMLGVLAFEGMLIYKPLLHQLTRALQHLLQASVTDNLTQVLNRNTFLRHADAELAQSRNTHQPLALILADLDHFKQLNDRHGHAAADFALRHFTAVVQSNLRSNDRIGRIGGAEFAILLCDTEFPGALLAAERIRERLAGSTAVLMPDNFRVFVTCSLGVTSATPGESLTSLLARAGNLLSQAKNSGRNRVESAPPAPSTIVATDPALVSSPITSPIPAPTLLHRHPAYLD